MNCMHYLQFYSEALVESGSEIRKKAIERFARSAYSIMILRGYRTAYAWYLR